jgi:ribosome-associated protein
MKQVVHLQTEQLKQIAIDALQDLKAVDIRVLDVTGITSVTDVLVIASATSSRQLKALANHVVEKSRQHGVRPLGVEGERGGEWALVDLGDVVVHIMLPQIRDFYNLEKLWSVEPGASNRAGD